MSNGNGKIATIGNFDGVHLGHKAVCRLMRDYAAEKGMQSLVVTFSNHPMHLIRRSSTPLLLSTPEQKARLLKEAGIDEVAMLDFDEQLRSLTAEEFMRALRDKYDVRALLLGFNHRFGSDRIKDFDDYRKIGQRLGIEVILSPLHVSASHLTVSSSAIRALISDGDIQKANEMLKYPYQISGIVTHGQGNGHKIGFPTANVVPGMPQQLIPKGGVYAAYAYVDADNHRYPAMVNIGTRPTITDGTAAPTIEAHLLGYDGDLYGHEVTLQFMGRLRDERKFDSIAQLSQQIEKDKLQAVQLLK